MKYITRFRFILGLSKYNEDDSVYEREERILEPFKNRDSKYWNILHNWKIQTEESKERKFDYDSKDNLIYHQINKMMKQKENPFDKAGKIIDEFLLNTHQDLDEQELTVCREIVWRLIHKDILSQGLDHLPSGYPYIFLSFVKDPGEGIRAINELFYGDILAFFGPHTDYDSSASIKP